MATGTNYASFSTTGNKLNTIYSTYITKTIANNQLDVFGVNVPSPGIFPVEFSVKTTVGSTLIYHQTYDVLVNPEDLASVSVAPVTFDTDRPTVYIIKFTTSDTIPSGAFPYSFSNPTSVIKIDFETSGACADFFRTDLGTGLADYDTIPCYGISNISRRICQNCLLIAFFFTESRKRIFIFKMCSEGSSKC